MKFQPLNKTTNIPYPTFAGGVVACTFTTFIPAGLAADDIVEIGVLPHGCSIVDAKLVADDIGIKADVGFIPDEKGIKTCGDELATDADMTTASVSRVDKAEAFRSGTAEKERFIGLKVKTGTSKSGLLTLLISYTA